MKVKRADNPAAIKEREPFLICELLETGEYQIVESQFNEPRADLAMEKLYEHAKRIGQVVIYEIFHIDLIEVY